MLLLYKLFIYKLQVNYSIQLNMCIFIKIMTNSAKSSEVSVKIHALSPKLHKISLKLEFVEKC